MAPSSCLTDSFSMRAVEKCAPVQRHAPAAPWNMTVSDNCSPVHRKHDTAERPWHDAVVPPSSWIDHVEPQSLRTDTAEKVGQLQQEAVEGYDLQLLSTNASCDTSVQEHSPSVPQIRTLCNPVNAYGAIARPPSSPRQDANIFANSGQWHLFLRDSTEERSSHSSPDLPPQRPMPSARNSCATARNSFHCHASIPSLKTSFPHAPQSTLESSSSVDDGSRDSVISSPTLPPRWYLNSLNPLRSPEDVMYDTIAQMSEYEMGHLWKTHKAKYFFERSARACCEGQLDRVEGSRQHPESRRRAASRLSVFEALVDQKAQTIRSPIQVPRDPTQSLPESNNRRTRRMQRRLFRHCGVRPDLYSASQQAPSEFVPSESQSTVSTTVQPTLSEAEAQTLREMIKAMMKDYLALEKISLARTSPRVEEWIRMNTATGNSPKPASKNGHIALITEYPIEQHSEQRHLTLEEDSEQGDPTLEEHTKQKSTALMTETDLPDFKDTVAVNDQSPPDSQDDPEASGCEYEDANTSALLLLDDLSLLSPLVDAQGMTLADHPSLEMKGTTRHGNHMLEEYSGQDQIRSDGHMEPKGTVANGPCPPACQGDFKSLNCAYEDANPYALLLLEEGLFKLPILEDEPGTTLSDPPSPSTMPLPPETPAKKPRKQARKRCSNARVSRKKCSLSVESALATEPTQPSISPTSLITPSEPSQATLVSRSATILDLQLLLESMVVDPPTESALMCAKILEAAPPSVLAARMRIQLYRDPDNEDAAFLGYDVCELLQSGPCCMSQWNGSRFRFEFPGEGHDHFNMPMLPYDHTDGPIAITFLSLCPSPWRVWSLRTRGSGCQNRGLVAKRRADRIQGNESSWSAIVTKRWTLFIMD